MVCIQASIWKQDWWCCRHWTTRNRYVVINWHDSILKPRNQGKSCFLFHLLIERLSAGKPTALEMFHDRIFLFCDSGAMAYSKKTFTNDMLPKGTWALADSRDTIEKPCKVFLESPNTFVIQATSPKVSRWTSWLKRKKGKEFWMDHNTTGEFEVLG